MTAGVEDISTVGSPTGNTVMVIVLEVAGLLVAQPMLLVKTVLTTSPELRELLLYVADEVGTPALLPLIRHWYKGLEPPLTGVAVKLIALPLHTVLLAVAMLTLAVLVAWVMVTVAVAVVVARQPVPLPPAVICTPITSLLARVLVANVALVAPLTGELFLYH